MIKAYRWYGGKFRMVSEINALTPEHSAYYEPFMGSAAVLLNRKRSQLEVINDLDKDLVWFMKTLADREKGAELVERLCKLWYGKDFFMEALNCKRRNFRGMSDIDKAVMIYIMISQSFNATRKNFSKGAYADTQDYRDDIFYNIPKVYERLKDVKVLNMNGIDLLSKISDKENAFALVDPPYRHSLRGKGATNVYACELPHSEQIRLLKTIRKAKCKIMLCGYKQTQGRELYDIYLLPCGWHCYKLCDVVKSCQTKSEKDIAEEYIWVNYELPYEAKYVISLKEHRTI